MAEEQTETEAEEQPKGGGLVKKLIFAGLGLVLVAVGIFIGPMLLGGGDGEEATADGEAAEEVAEVPSGPPIYQSLHPPLVVNVKSEGGDSHFMQITMEVMSRNQGVINSIREHTPVIRNSLILLYGNVMYESVQTREGKEEMLADGLDEIRRVMQETTGESEHIEALYFTALVIQ